MKRLGLIGCGSMGLLHASAVARIPGAAFVAFLDRTLEVAADACAKFGGEYATTDVRRLLDDETLDAVYICTRNDSHAQLAISAAHAGKHILIEKPLSLKLQDGLAVAEAAQTTNVYLMPAFKMRYYPLVRRAHEFIPEPQVIVAQMMDQPWDPNGWAQDPVQGGGNVASQGCHMADLLHYLASSEVASVCAVSGAVTHPSHPCADQCLAAIQFRNGHMASLIQGDAARPEPYGKLLVQLFHQGRSVTLYDRLTKATFSDGTRQWTDQRESEEGVQLENEEFISALIEDRKPELTVEDALNATRLLVAAQESARTGIAQNLAAPMPTLPVVGDRPATSD